jgi:hypothetical protein
MERRTISKMPSIITSLTVRLSSRNETIYSNGSGGTLGFSITEVFTSQRVHDLTAKGKNNGIQILYDSFN